MKYVNLRVDMLPWSILADSLSLFIPATLGIYGSYRLYITKQEQRKKNLRNAFLAEVEGIEFLETWPLEGRTVPSFNFLSVSVYDGNSGDLALLKEQEVSALVRYYTRAKAVREALNFHTEVIVRNQSSTFASDVNKSDRVDAIRELIDKLELSRQRALMVLKTDLSEETLPREGNKAAKWGSLESVIPLLLDYGFVTEKGDDHLITTDGEEFFRGNLNLTGRGKDRDTLERDKSHFRRTWENRYRRLKSLLSN